MNYDSVITELREELPSAARVIEDAVAMLESKELSWELVMLVAVITGKARDHITAMAAGLDGLSTVMEEHRRIRELSP